MNKVNNFKPYNYLNFGTSKTTKELSKFLAIDNSDYSLPIKEAMKRLSTYNIEHGIIFTKDGRLIKESMGDNKCAFLTQNEQNDFMNLAKSYPEWILLHNHPNMDSFGKPNPITIPDAFISMSYNASESIVVHPDGSYSSVKCLPNEKNFTTKSLSAISFLMYKGRPENYDTSGKIRDEFWRNNANKLGVIYTNTYKY